MRNYFTISPKKLWQYTDNREKECVESHDCLHPEVTGHKKKKRKGNISRRNNYWKNEELFTSNKNSKQ